MNASTTRQYRCPRNVANCSLMSSSLAHTDAQPGIHNKVQQVNNQVDDHKNQGNQAQVSCHDRDVDKLDRLDEQQTHSRPLKNGFCHDRESNDAAELQAGDGDDGYQGVLECVSEMNRPLG